MNILTNGKAIRKSGYGLVAETTVSGAAVASVTFSGLQSDDQLALDLRWLHSSTGVQRLDLELNGDPAPSGSKMTRSQFETTLGVREDRLDPGFTLADLVATIASGTFWEGVAYILGDATNEEPTYVIGEGYSEDANLILADRIRFSTRSGRWNDSTMSGMTSLTAVVAGGQSRIDINSQFRLFN